MQAGELTSYFLKFIFFTKKLNLHPLMCIKINSRKNIILKIIENLNFSINKDDIMLLYIDGIIY